jgi:hypothetical protein
MRHALDDARANRIGDEHEHDRYGACRAPQWLYRSAPRSEDQVGRKRDQLRCVFACVILAAPGPAVVDLNVVANAPTRLLQPLQKCRVAGLRLRIVRGVKA